MKWPTWVKLIRHDTSEYNLLKDKKKGSELYTEFLKQFKKDPRSDITRGLSVLVREKFALGIGDAKTNLADKDGVQALRVGYTLALENDLPDVIFVSPYRRAKLTLEHITRGWPGLAGVKTYEDERVREQEHGLALIYNDWRVFHALHPEQKTLHDFEGPYWYRYPQGENVPDVRARNRDWLRTITRDFAQKKILVVTHHLNILAMRANLERMSAEEFIRIDEKDKPINCGVTTYVGIPNEGSDGRLKLKSYNVKLY